MDSNTHQVYNQDHLPADSSLLRFRSAPSSFLATFSDIEKGGFDSDGLISRFVSSNGGNGDLDSLSEFEDKSPVTVTDASITYTAALPLPPPASHSGLPPHYPRQSEAVMRSPGMDVSYQFLTTNHHTKPLESNLVRQSSSPAGMFTNLSVQNGYGSMKSLVNCGADEERSPSSNGLKRHFSRSTRSSSSSLGILSQISELENEIIGSGVQYGHWNDPSSFIDNFPCTKTEPDKDNKMFSGVQNGETVNRIQMLTHHLSLPKKSSEMGSAEKFLQFQDSVPCKIRARRGCATHPRSIAERVRRTRISERMKKLQELVPNMDKQTNTADMLDLAVEYIKDLQRQFKNLSDIRANCKCLNSEKKPMQNQTV